MPTPEVRMKNAYAAAGGKNVAALPWTLIIQAIVALLPIICPAAMAKRWAKRNPEACKEAIANVLKAGQDSGGVVMSSGDRSLVVDSAYAAFLKMTPGEIEELR